MSFAYSLLSCAVIPLVWTAGSVDVASLTRAESFPSEGCFFHALQTCCTCTQMSSSTRHSQKERQNGFVLLAGNLSGVF